VTRTARLLAPIAAATAILGAGACGPGAFDGISSGTTEDPKLVAPRPIAPLSVSWFATRRPRLTWELTGDLNGAVVELCRTRACAKNETKTFPTVGRELVVPEDLDLGVWYWHLLGRTAKTTGTVFGPTWEFVLRGPAIAGSSDRPTGAIVDLNGDGLPDLLAGGADTDGRAIFSAFRAVESGIADGSDESFGFDIPPGETPTTDALSLGGGTDIDGDGFTDAVHVGFDTYDTVREPPHAYVEFGSAMQFDYSKAGPPIHLYAAFGPLPRVREAGDINADGYGDAVVGSADFGFVLYGSRGGTGGAIGSFSVDAAQLPRSRAVLGAFDANGDGISEIVMGTAERAPATVYPGEASLALDKMKRVEAEGPVAAAVAFASGDFDGDGLADLAMTVPNASGSRVCFALGRRSDEVLVPDRCIVGLEGDTDFGASLTAGDLEGDGKDELLATAKNGGHFGMRAVRYRPDGLGLESIEGTGDLGLALTTLWPGRPGKARWAATSADAKTVVIFEGVERREALERPEGDRGRFGLVLR
jgi:FG-GAP repeat